MLYGTDVDPVHQKPAETETATKPAAERPVPDSGLEHKNKPVKVTEAPTTITSTTVTTTSTTVTTTTTTTNIPVKVTNTSNKVTGIPLKVTDIPVNVTDIPVDVTDDRMMNTAESGVVIDASSGDSADDVITQQMDVITAVPFALHVSGSHQTYRIQLHSLLLSVFAATLL